MSGKILCSTGCLIGRRNGFNHLLISEYVPQLSCDGIELMIYEVWYDRLKEILGDIKRSGVPVVTLHEDKQIGELISRNEGDDCKIAIERHKRNCEAAAELGAGLLVLHAWNGIPSDRHIEFNIETFAQLSEISASFGLLLTAENVICNKESPLKHLCELADRYPDARFTFDTKMASFHGELARTCACKRLWEENRFAHIHVNDHSGAVKDWSDFKVRHIGDGTVDFGLVFETLRKYNYSGDYTLECPGVKEDGSLMLDKLNASIEKVRGFIVPPRAER